MGWRWVSLETAVDAHQAQLEEHGGGEGIRDAGLLESVMARPQNLAAYGDPDAADLAAAFRVFESLAAGKLSEPDLAACFRERLA